MTNTAQLSEDTCRLCGGRAVSAFSLRILDKYPVSYFRCGHCGSLQTEPPYWLDEAYSAASDKEARDDRKNLADLDTGAASRSIRNLALVMVVCRLMGAKNVLDLGGGDGLLCRLLRDRSINAYVSDPFAEPTYAQGFTEPHFDAPDLLTAFEVFEHLPNPADDLARILAKGAPVVLASTDLYNGQGPEWWYLTPQTGQHVFFYTYNALAEFAQKHDYDFFLPAGFTLFVKKGALRWRTLSAMHRLLKPAVLRWYGAWLNLRPSPGVEADFRALGGGSAVSAEP